MLIGKQVITAPILKQSSLEVLPTGYMLIDSGKPTTVSYMSNTTPIPAEKNAVAACTAMAGEMLGLKLIFMDGGSGAKNPISEQMIAAVSKSVDAPLIIGGGISSGDKAAANCKAGADIIVVGNAIEKEVNLIIDTTQYADFHKRSETTYPDITIDELDLPFVTLTNRNGSVVNLTIVGGGDSGSGIVQGFSSSATVLNESPTRVKDLGIITPRVASDSKKYDFSTTIDFV